MKIAVVFGSQRRGGTHGKIEEMLVSLPLHHAYDFIRMDETRIEGCVACQDCAATGICVLPGGENDRFHEVLHRLAAADAILIVTPVYAPIPSRLTALFERLLSISYFSHQIGKLERPLKGKPTAIISYDSGKIGDETQIKMIFQRFLMDDYSFSEVSYPFLNNVPEPNAKYGDVVAYVKDVVTNL